jgi:hypothetical protein
MKVYRIVSREPITYDELAQFSWHAVEKK